jgi:hypothetical protein
MNLFGKILIILPVVALFFHYMGDLVVIDSCLDSGRAFDYKSGVCGNEEHYEPISYLIRYWWWLLLNIVAVFTGISFFTKISKATPKSGSL